MLLRGVCTFEPRLEDHEDTLSFTCNDNLIFLHDLKRDPNWLRVIDIFGRMGFVPKVWVEPDQRYADTDLILTFLMDASVKARQNGLQSASKIELIRNKLREDPSIIQQTAELMLKLFKDFTGNKTGSEISFKSKGSTSGQRVASSGRRLHSKGTSSARRHEFRQIESDSELEPGINRNLAASKKMETKKTKYRPYNWETENDGYQSESSVKTAIQADRRKMTDIACKTCSGSVKVAPVPSSHSLHAIKSNLVNVVRETSGLDHASSENILIEVFQCIKESTNTVPVSVDSLVEKLSLTSISSAKSSKVVNQLEQAMVSITKLSKPGVSSRIGTSSRTCMSSSEQSVFVEKLDHLRKLLIECETAHSSRLLKLNQYSFPRAFVDLYNLQTPEIVKERILDILLIICRLDKKGRTALLSTSLPINLGRDLLGQIGNDRNERKLPLQLVNLLTALFSCGERMPETHFEIIGTGFVNYVFKEIEDTFESLSESENKTFAHARLSSMVNLALAYNLQFVQSAKENIVLKVLSGQWKRPRGFFSVLLKIFKTAIDPLQTADYKNSLFSTPPPHSIFQMVSDICSCQGTASLFVKSEKNALLEAVVNGLFDNSAGTIRLKYIQVLRIYLAHLQDFSLNDARAALLNILLDSDPLAITEQQEIRAMSKEFPAIFARNLSRAKDIDDIMITTDGEGSLTEENRNNNNGRSEFIDYLYISS